MSLLIMAVPLQVSPAAAHDAASRGTVSVAVVSDGEGDSAARQASGEAVAAALSDAGFLVLPGSGAGRYFATITVRHERRGSVTTPTTVPGPATNLGQWGARLNVTLPSAKQVVRDLVVTRLTVTITARRGDEKPWSGTAVTAKADDGRSGVVVRRLATALISRFPQVLAGPLSVP